MTPETTSEEDTETVRESTSASSENAREETETTNVAKVRSSG